MSHQQYYIFTDWRCNWEKSLKIFDSLEFKRQFIDRQNSTLVLWAEMLVAIVVRKINLFKPNPNHVFIFTENIIFYIKLYQKYCCVNTATPVLSLQACLRGQR